MGHRRHVHGGTVAGVRRAVLLEREERRAVTREFGLARKRVEKLLRRAIGVAKKTLAGSKSATWITFHKVFRSCQVI